jgi:2-amino-4-hydroxy-6-hydroxymethyldihydropteridine diphosphokinase
MSGSSQSVRVYLSLGSNINRYQHIHAGLDALFEHFGELQISPVYESKSVGFDGSNFFNLVVGIATELSIPALSEVLKKIEDENGRSRSGPKFSPRTLDIDILTYGDFVGVDHDIALPRAEITQNAFVLLPLTDLAAHQQHPQLGKTYAELWRAYDKQSQTLWPVEFIWRGAPVSQAAG